MRNTGNLVLPVNFVRENRGTSFSTGDSSSTSDTDAAQTWLQSDAANLTDAAGNTDASAGAGDIVVEAEEVTDGGTFDFSIMVQYLTN